MSNITFKLLRVIPPGSSKLGDYHESVVYYDGVDIGRIKFDPVYRWRVCLEVDAAGKSLTFQDVEAISNEMKRLIKTRPTAADLYRLYLAKHDIHMCLEDVLDKLKQLGPFAMGELMGALNPIKVVNNAMMNNYHESRCAGHRFVIMWRDVGDKKQTCMLMHADEDQRWLHHGWSYPNPDHRNAMEWEEASEMMYILTEDYPERRWYSDGEDKVPLMVPANEFGLP